MRLYWVLRIPNYPKIRFNFFFGPWTWVSSIEKTRSTPTHFPYISTLRIHKVIVCRIATPTQDSPSNCAPITADAMALYIRYTVCHRNPVIYGICDLKMRNWTVLKIHERLDRNSRPGTILICHIEANCTGFLAPWLRAWHPNVIASWVVRFNFRHEISVEICTQMYWVLRIPNYPKIRFNFFFGPWTWVSSPQ